MDIFNITLLQLISKLVKVIFLKIVTIFLWRNFSDSYAVLVLYIITQIKEIFKLLWAIGSIWHYGGCLNKRAARLRLAVQAPAIWADGIRRNSKAHGNGRPPLNRLAIRPRRESCRAAKRAQNTTAYSLTDARSASSEVHSPYLRHLPETKEKRPSRSGLWADGETILMGESPYSERR